MGLTMSFNVLVAIVIINVLATLALWQTTTKLRRAVWHRPGELKKQFTDALWESKPIAPKHRPPKVIGEGFSSLVTDTDEQFFKDFEDFADVVNWWFANPNVGSPWRLEELPDTELMLNYGSDMPSFGRRYSIYHNQAKVGTLEVSPSLPETNVDAEISLDYARLLPVSTIRSLFGGIAEHICDRDPAVDERSKAQTAIDDCLIDALWRTQQVSQYNVLDSQDYGNLDLRINGSAKWYFGRRGSAGFAKWKEQRP